MSELNSIITVNIDRQTVVPTAQGFGVPLLAVQHSYFADRVRSYSSVAEMVAAGFTTTEPGYLLASAAFAQNPSPPTIKIGRLANQQTQAVEFTPTDVTVGLVYSLTVTGPGALTGETFTYTVQTSDTVELIIDGLVADMAGNTGNWTPTDGITKLTIDADNAGERFAFSSYNLEMDFKDVTPVAAIATDLDAILAADTDFYGLAIESTDKASIVAASAWVETNKRLFIARTSDDECLASGVSDDVISTLGNGTNTRTAIWFHRDNLDPIDAAMLGKALPTDAGSINWAWKQLATINADTLTSAQSTQIDTKGGNTFTSIAGVNVTKFGMTTNGEGIDLIRGSDWVAARMQERVYTLLIQRPKLPYTDSGLQTIRGVMQGVLSDGIDRDFIAAYPEPVVTVPAAADVSTSDKANRIANDVTFAAVLAGAINKVVINGTLSLT